jgi:hypothetical protein
VGRVGVGSGVGVASGSVGVTGTLGVGTGSDGVAGTLGVGTGSVGTGPVPLGAGAVPDALGVGFGDLVATLAWSLDASCVISGDRGASACGLSAR